MEILHEVLDALPSVVSRSYDRVLMKAILLTCYHGALRAGEAVKSGSITRTIKIENVTILQIQLLQDSCLNSFLSSTQNIQHHYPSSL